MAQTSNYGFHITPASEATTTNVIDWRESLDGAGSDSLVNRIDTELKKVENKIDNGDFATKTEVSNAVQTERVSREQAIQSETTARTQANTVLERKITAETNARNAKDTELEQKINNIPKTVINDTLTSDSTTEALSSKQGKVLKELIKLEEQTRQEADNNLQNKISTVENTVADTSTTVSQALSKAEANEKVIEQLKNTDGGGIDFSLGYGELEDYEFEVGEFTNAGAGWNIVYLNKQFDSSPSVYVQAIDFEGIVLIKNITRSSFQYCLKEYTLTGGSVDTKSYPIPDKDIKNSYVTTVSTPLVNNVVFPNLTTKTTSENHKIQYLAVHFGGEY